MDNHKEEDIILPETEGIINDDTPAPVKTPNKPHKKLSVNVPIILAVAGFLALAIALVIVATNKGSEPAPLPVSTDDTYYNREEFNSAMSLAETRAMQGDYVGAKAYLDTYNKTELMTNSQKYHFFQIMTLVYSENGYNEPARVAEYTRLADEALEEIRRGKE